MQHLLNEIIPFVSHYGLWVVFVGVIVEGTMMIIITGILCYLGMLDIKEAVLVAILGAVTGDQLWYILGKYYSGFILDRFSLLKQKIYSLKPKIEQKGKWFAFGGRFVYSGAILFPLGLGTYNYPHYKFTLFDTIGVTIWSILGISIGYTFGSGAEEFIGKIDKVWHFVLLAVGIYLLVWIVKYYFSKKDYKG